VIDEAEGELLALGALAALQATLAEETEPVPVAGDRDGV
jgi:adenosylmethionine-8-amino-7-oxononanoate aminotransferase